MKKNKLKLIIGIVVCVVLAGVVTSIALLTPNHKHNLGSAKTYHIANDGIYYTRLCKDGCVKRFETKASFEDVLTTVSSQDNIILDEDIVLENEIKLKSFVAEGQGIKGVTLNINLDLNNYGLITNVEQTENNSMFMLNASYGKINFNVKNGKLYSQDLTYLFRFANNTQLQDSIVLSFNNVECKVVGDEATPIFAHNESSSIKVNAINSKFIAEKSTAENADYGVGVFINSKSEFNFNNCYFEGGDAVYVKQGTVNLTDCTLVNVGLAKRVERVSEELFYAMGTCLATESNMQTQFDIVIENCNMIGNSSSTMIYVAQTSIDGSTPQINTESKIDIVSCTFTENPKATIPDYGIIVYADGQEPQNQGEQLWVVG